VSALRGAPGAKQRLPRDVVALIVVLGIVVLGGLVALFWPYGPNRSPALLGVIDRPPAPAHSPSPSPRR
jgi:hypothetical protein